MDSKEVITGQCPCCKKQTKFREFSFTENLISLGGFVTEFVAGGLSTKVKNAAAAVNSFSDARSFPNYKCGNCAKEVMQCSVCDEIIPYEHDGTSHICGA